MVRPHDLHHLTAAAGGRHLGILRVARPGRYPLLASSESRLGVSALGPVAIVILLTAAGRPRSRSESVSQVCLGHG